MALILLIAVASIAYAVYVVNVRSPAYERTVLIKALDSLVYFVVFLTLAFAVMIDWNSVVYFGDLQWVN